MLIAEYDYDMDIQVQREEAYEDGIEAGITGVLRTYKEFHISRGAAEERLMKGFGITKEEAEKYLETYWE